MERSTTRPAAGPATPAELYAALIGGLLVIVGILGFFYEASFETGAAEVEADEVLGILAVNGWHNLLHIVTGVLGLAAAAGGWARTYALAIGLVYVIVAIWGFADGDEIILGLLPVNAEDNVFHLILGLLGLGTGAATPVTARPASARSNGS